MTSQTSLAEDLYGRVRNCVRCPLSETRTNAVPLVGATAHYASAELDEGPIIAQDVAAVTHRDSILRRAPKPARRPAGAGRRC